MFRKSALALTLSSVLATGNVLALGLGDIDLKSALNQPFNAEIELLSATEDELNELKVLLGSRQAFSNAGIDRSVFLSKLKFTVTQSDDRRPIIRVTSRDPVTEPFLDFLLEVSWSKGKLLREYTVLVDPPVTMPAAPVSLEPPTVRPVTAPVAAAPAAPARTVRNTALPPLSKRPVATQSPPVSQTTAVGSAEYGPTQRNDTLWHIAERVRPDAEVSMEQTMMALLRANPGAFTNNNINNLKTGQVLRVPDRDEMTAMSKADARQAARAQYEDWKRSRTGISAPAAATGSVASSNAAEATPGEASSEARLQLVAPDLDQAGGSGAGGDEQAETITSLKRDLVLANEALEAQRSESQEMARRLSVLEEQIKNMQRLIQLKDDELARLQATAGGEAVSATAESSTALDASSPETATGAVDDSPQAAAQDTITPVMPAAPVETASETRQRPAEEPPVSAETAAPAETTDNAVDAAAATPDSPVAGLVDQVMKNPLWLAAGAGVLALLAFFGLRGRRGSETEFQESILRSSADDSVIDDDLTDFSAPRSQTSNAGDSSLLSEFAVSDMASEDNQGEADPLAEADVYLAYGRFQQAEELLKEALANQPEREDLHLKLLEVFQAEGNVEGFDGHAESVLARSGDRNDPVWQKVAEMGLAFNPANPLYHPEGTLPGGETVTDEAAASTEPADSDISHDNVTSLDAAQGANSMSYDPDVDAVQQDVSEVVQDTSLDFDLENFDLGAHESGDQGQEDGELADLDEISTKLDLARAYIDMGDPEGARNILGEVIEEGNDDQKNEAQGILEKLAS